LIDQAVAYRAIEPHADQGWYWFGESRLCLASDGNLLVVDRYRNAANSTFASAKGRRSAEPAYCRIVRISHYGFN
jgi:hypothetical protein